MSLFLIILLVVLVIYLYLSNKILRQDLDYLSCELCAAQDYIDELEEAYSPQPTKEVPLEAPEKPVEGFLEIG